MAGPISDSASLPTQIADWQIEKVDPSTNKFDANYVAKRKFTYIKDNSERTLNLSVFADFEHIIKKINEINEILTKEPSENLETELTRKFEEINQVRFHPQEQNEEDETKILADRLKLQKPLHRKILQRKKLKSPDAIPSKLSLLEENTGLKIKPLEETQLKLLSKKQAVSKRLERSMKEGNFIKEAAATLDLIGINLRLMQVIFQKKELLNFNYRYESVELRSLECELENLSRMPPSELSDKLGDIRVRKHSKERKLINASQVLLNLSKEQENLIAEIKNYKSKLDKKLKKEGLEKNLKKYKEKGDLKNQQKVIRELIRIISIENKLNDLMIQLAQIEINTRRDELADKEGVLKIERDVSVKRLIEGKIKDLNAQIDGFKESINNCLKLQSEGSKRLVELQQAKEAIVKQLSKKEEEIKIGA
jgi:hypothetical protein